MKILAGFLLLSATALAQGTLVGTWHGTAAVKGQEVPLTLRIDGSGSSLHAALLNGPESSPASSVVVAGGHLTAKFDYFARTLDATLADGKLTGTFGNAAATYPFSLHPAEPTAAKSEGPGSLAGDWEIAVQSAKGESAWQLRIDAPVDGHFERAVIQRIDGDTGSLYGFKDAGSKETRFSHYTAAGPALYSVLPQADGTLLVTNLLRDDQKNLVARRPAEARKEKLAAPTDPTQQTTLKDPAVPLRFSAPDLTGKVVSSSDARFEGKVVIVAVGGSWCPNCHDEAPFLESLYKRFHASGLEVVDLSFEEADQLKDPERLRAFIARYGITYPVLLAGEPEQLQEKLTQAKNLNCWPTSFFLGRDGRVREIHAGFAGPANPPAHVQLQKDVTALVEELLREPVPTHNASR